MRTKLIITLFLMFLCPLLSHAGTLPAPGGLVIWTGDWGAASTAQITLQWNNVTGATSYNVEKATAPNGPYTVISTNTNSYIDNSVSNGITYYYMVAMVNANGVGPYSAQVSATPEPAAVSYAIIATAGSNGSITPSSTMVASGGSQKFTVTPNTGYTAFVSIDGSSAMPLTNTNIVYIGNVTAPHTITANFVQNTYTITATASSNGTITPTSASVPYNGSQKFTVTPNTGYTAYVSIDGSSAMPLTNTNIVDVGNVTASHTLTVNFTLNSYTITATAGNNGVITPVSANVPYGGNQSFTVTPNPGYTAHLTLDGVAVNLPFNSNTFSITNVITPHTIAVTFTLSLPAPPGGLTASVINGQATLSWNTSTGAFYYNVKRSASLTGPFTTLVSWVGNTYPDSSAASGTTYYYVVSAVNASGESLNSAPAAVTTPQLPLSIPSGLEAFAGNGYVVISWNPITAATSYTVSRSTVSSGPYTKLPNPVTSNYYQDSSVSNGTTYYYVVSAANAVSQSTNSALVSATPAAPGYTLIVNAANGTVTQNSAKGSSTASSVTYNAGTVVNLTASAAQGYQFSSWSSQSGHVTGTANPFPLTMNTNENVTANFTPVTTPWTALPKTPFGFTNITPSAIETMLLLTDGSVIGLGDDWQTWYRLTPDKNGNYTTGTWSTIAKTNITHDAFGSVVLTDGRVMLAGGEWGNGGNVIEIYDPNTNVWSRLHSWDTAACLSDEGHKIADSSLKILADGRALLASTYSKASCIYDPPSDTWSMTPDKIDYNSEESLAQLPDGSLITMSFNGSPPNFAERYLPWNNTWVNLGNSPVILSEDEEFGPIVLLYDGRAMFFGSNGNTAFYLPASSTFQAGPSVPNSMTPGDAPGVVMPNGHVLLLADSSLTKSFTPPSSLFEYDPVSNSYTNVPSPDPSVNAESAEGGHFLVIPTGQILFTDSNGSVWAYTPSGKPNAAWQPTVTSIHSNDDGSFTVTGTQLNGLTEGAYFCDDAQMSTNYPLIKLVDNSGRVYYAKTYGFSTMGVATGQTPVTANFSVAGIPPGIYSLYVVTNGIASKPVAFTIATSNYPPTVVTPASANPNPVTAANTTQLNVLGQDFSGESTLVYAWSVTNKPNNVQMPTFSTNGTNGAKNTVVTFYAPGSYAFQVTITNSSGLTTSSASKNVTVNTSIVRSITISPTSVTLADGRTQQFSAVATDQFGATPVQQPTFSWSVVSRAGGVLSSGTINANGLYTAPASGFANDTISVSDPVSGIGATTTVNTGPLPATPVLTVTAQLSNNNQVTVTLTWTVSSMNTSTFGIQRSDGMFTPVSGTFLTFTDSAVKPKTSYSYQVIALNSYGHSSSNIVTITTP